jgi:hypothetical protein
MAGSDESGEDMESGRVNRAEDRTIIWAQRTAESPFNGDSVFIVERAGDIEDDDFSVPFERVHAIRGVGLGDGAGVIGLSGLHTQYDAEHLIDVGVFGVGNTGVRGEGFGNPGVEGLGKDRPFNAIDGVGVFGRGGRQPDDRNDDRKPHGPGVVGLGGGRSRKLDHHDIVQSVGVFGQGAEAETRTVDGVEHGPRQPGAGVVGRGGESIPRGTVAPGVVGWAGGADPLPVPVFTGDIGTLGYGGTGVTGIALAGPGVHGIGSDGEGGAVPNRGQIGPGVLAEGGVGLRPGATDVFMHAAGVIGLSGEQNPPATETNEIGVYGRGREGVKGFGSASRGGRFQSQRSAQVNLVPAKRAHGRDQVAVIPTVLANPGMQGPELPRDGERGDLMSVVNDDAVCTLWFCVESPSGAGPARWAQVLLGPLFDGRS